MLETLAFITRARTVDHLGRGQIADCPTAISELWKNSYDAYARNVSLNIYSGQIPVAALSDDGHGMNKTEFIEKWLVVGTESKAISGSTPLSDRNGLKYRPKQGQKGIGRLSSGYLGPLLLLVSKRRGSPFVAALLDWRLFQNPFLLLHDIEIPITTFDRKEELLSLIDPMLTKLVDNIWGHGDENQKSRIESAWSKLDEIEGTEGETFLSPTTRQSIENLLVSSPFSESHLQQWPVWNDVTESGTLLLVADIDFDLRAQLDSSNSPDSTTSRAQRKFFEILSSFCDPFPDPGIDQILTSDSDFSCSVIAWNGPSSKVIIGKEREFDLSVIQQLEHVIDGRIDEDGTFVGRVKAFGTWLEGDIVIPIIGNLELPKRSDTKVGGFNLYIASMEFDRSNTTHTPEQWSKFKDLAKLYSGFMVYRDGLRVMPYGRSSNDFFEIERRRSLSAGREFWNLRQMFGRIALTRLENPNLRDKAGREGLIDNRSAKGLRDIVENVLMTSARRYFGSKSEIRAKVVPGLKADYQLKKDEEQRKKFTAQQRRAFSSNLVKWTDELPRVLGNLNTVLAEINNNYDTLTEQKVMLLREAVSDSKDQVSSFKLGTAPRKLGPLDEIYRTFKSDCALAKSIAMEAADRLQARLAELNPKAPEELAKQELQRNSNQIKRKIRAWASSINEILSAEEKRLQDIANDRIQSYFTEMSGLITDVRHRRLQLREALNTFELERERVDDENEDLYVPYITALESLKLSIDLASLASSGAAEIGGLREELDRITSLAQLGITIEIIGHELEGFDEAVATGLNSLPNDIRELRAIESIRAGHAGLTERLRFLSPLKLSGPAKNEWISGNEIFIYVTEFFGEKLSRDHILFSASDDFKRFKIFESRARIYPVFVNLVNNSRYWVCQQQTEGRKIELNIIQDKVVVSDSGPGVEEGDISSLFKLFFTRKRIGGRGVGLYLCRANLGASGHQIEYIRSGPLKKLNGANFAIIFNGGVLE